MVETKYYEKTHSKMLVNFYQQNKTFFVQGEQKLENKCFNSEKPDELNYRDKYLPSLHFPTSFRHFPFFIVIKIGNIEKKIIIQLAC